jgi:hypothetical protein
MDSDDPASNFVSYSHITHGCITLHLAVLGVGFMCMRVCGSVFFKDLPWLMYGFGDADKPIKVITGQKNCSQARSDLPVLLCLLFFSAAHVLQSVCGFAVRNTSSLSDKTVFFTDLPWLLYGFGDADKPIKVGAVCHGNGALFMVNTRKT